ncbi:MAG: hypothetical protein AAFY60_05250, partial [Myxococcota bacterium]
MTAPVSLRLPEASVAFEPGPRVPEEKELGLPLATPMGPASRSFGQGVAAFSARALAFLRGLRLKSERPALTDAAVQGALILAVNERGSTGAADAVALTGALWKSHRPQPAVPESARNGLPFGRIFDGLGAQSAPPTDSAGAAREVRALADAISSDLAVGRNVMLFPKDGALVDAILARRPETQLLLAAQTGKQVALSEVTEAYGKANDTTDWLKARAMDETGAEQGPAARRPS